MAITQNAWPFLIEWVVFQMGWFLTDVTEFSLTIYMLEYKLRFSSNDESQTRRVTYMRVTNIVEVNSKFKIQIQNSKYLFNHDVVQRKYI